MGAFEDFVYAEMPQRAVTIRGATDATGDPNDSVLGKVNGAPPGTWYLQDDTTPKRIWQKKSSASDGWELVANGGATSADFTYYVASGGDDTNDGLTGGTALATIQEAVDRVAALQDLGHAITVSIGEGIFVGAHLDGLNLSKSGASLNVKGTLGAPTLTTGTTSGTATSGTTTTKLVDSGQSWTTNELRGMFLLVSGQYRVIYSNTATEIYIHMARSGMASGSAYSIVVPKTIINSGEADGYGIITRGCTLAKVTDLVIQDIEISGTNGLCFFGTWGARAERMRLINCIYGFYVAYTYVRWDVETMYCEDGYYGALLLSDRGEHMEDFYSYSATLQGIYGGWTHYWNFENIAVSHAGSDGVSIQNVIYLDIKNLLVENCTGKGLNIDFDSSLDDEGSSTYFKSAISVELNDNGGDGLFLGNNTKAQVNALTGSGNSGYGVNVQNGSTLIFDGPATDLTGTSGDLTLDEGASALDWSTDFGSDGDSVTNISADTRARREDI